MKKGFTMIELVFVIVILGILASLAVPKLVATKDDAAAVKAASEMKDVITQLAAYYTINGSFPEDINNKKLGDLKKDVLDKYSKTMGDVKNRSNDQWIECVTVTPSNGGTEGANIKIEKVASVKSGLEGYCSAVRGTPAVSEWIKLAESNGIQVGGSGIFKEETTTN